MVKLILASGSATRQNMLRSAGIDFDRDPAKVDEVSIQSSLIAEGETPRTISDVLAEYKARQISASHSGLVLGSDQTLECDGQLMTKVSSIEGAKETLRNLQGKTHILHSAAVIYEDHQPVWRSIQSVRMTMRPLSTAQIDDYLGQTGGYILGSVGCYHFEELGAQLFTQVIGDYFSILGMPLLDVLGFLRTRGIGI